MAYKSYFIRKAPGNKDETPIRELIDNARIPYTTFQYDHNGEAAIIGCDESQRAKIAAIDGLIVFDDVQMDPTLPPQA